MSSELRQLPIEAIDGLKKENKNFTIVERLVLTEDDRVVDAITGEDAEKSAQIISRCKYGEIRAASRLASRLQRAAEQDPNFIAFLQEAQEAGSPVLLTSHGVYTFPTTSSKLIIDRLAGRLNTVLATHGLPSVILDDPIPDAEKVEEDFVTNSKLGIPMPRPSRVVQEGTLKGWSIIFVDDILVSEEKGAKTEAVLKYHAGADRVYRLYGASLDNATSENEFEAKVANRFYSPSLESLRGLLENPDSFEVMQRLIRAILRPSVRDSLPDFLLSIPDASVLKLYEAATSADFRQRYNGEYGPSIDILQRVLYVRGLVDKRGVIFETPKLIDPEIAALPQPHHVYTLELHKKSEVTREDAGLYSRMKHGDKEATHYFANRMADEILADSTIKEAVARGETIVLTASAYGVVPTAAAHIADIVQHRLTEAGVPIKRVKIHRNGNFATHNMGSMNQVQRAAEMKARQISIDEEDSKVVEGATVLVIDDLCATGSHERSIQSLMHKHNVGSLVFAYNVKFGESLMVNEPETEEWLNRVESHSTFDLLRRYHMLAEAGTVDESHVYVNARLVKFVLGLNPEPEYGLSVEKKKNYLIEFCEYADVSTLRAIYDAATSDDGYCYMDQYEDGFKIFEAILLERNIISMDEVNTAHERITTVNLKLSPEGQFVDAATGEVRNDIVEAYSLMKFGSVAEINMFGNAIAQAFISDLQNNKNGLFDRLTRIQAEGGHIALFVPGSRNVASSSNFVLERAAERINIALALMNLPTIVVMHLSRLGSNTANYATLSEAERKQRSAATKTILPGAELYQHSVHVIFGDDVRITGATADRVKQSALDNGAESVSELYALAIDPAVTRRMPEVEDALNSGLIDGSLNDSIRYILNQEGFRPVQRLVRLILQKSNADELEAFLMNDIQESALVKLYIAITNNDYLKDPRYAESGLIVKTILQNKGLLDESGLLL